MKKIFDHFSDWGKIKKKPEFDYQAVLPAQSRLPDEIPQFSRLAVFNLFSIIIGLVFGWKLIDLQITQGAKHLYLAEGNRIRLQKVLAPRGIIFDQNGIPLVQNILRYDLEIIPALLPDEKKLRDQYLEKVTAVTGLDMASYKDKIADQGLYSIDPLTLKEDLSQEESLAWQIEFRGMEGVQVSLKPLRRYQSGFGLAHILGYIGKISQEELAQDKFYHITDWIGKAGLEQIYEKTLRGQEGQSQIEVDAQGRLQRLVAEIPPQKGRDLKLQLDFNLQKRAYQALKAKAEELGNGRGVAIAIDPRDGGILALVSLPEYDNNLFVHSQNKDEIYRLFSDPNHPLVNRAISGAYPTGSTIKPLIASIALQERVVSERYKVDTPPEIEIGEWKFPDWKDHGMTDIRRAIAESNNIFFYALAGGWDKIRGLGIERLSRGLREFGWGGLTDIDLANEKPGLVPDANWKKEIKGEPWYLGDTYHLGIGQGDVAVTPIQLLTAIASIANAGTLYAPQLADMGEPKVLKKNFIDSYNLKIVREGMEMAVEIGSARGLRGIRDQADQPVKIAGKTGTAQIGKDGKTHAWLVCFAPAENPEIAIAVLVEEGGQGHEAALPVAKEMLEEYFR